MLVNGLRDLRTKSDEAILFQKSDKVNKSIGPFLIIMIIGIFISTLSTASILYQVYVIEKNKAEILSLYALLKMD